MEELKEKMQEFKTIWDALYEKIKDTPDIWKPYLPYSSLIELNEIVSTLNYWLDRLRAPSGFAPSYRLAVALAGTSLNSTLNSLKKLQGDDYNHFTVFLTGLNQLISALHSATVFADENQSREAIGNLGGKLSESLSLLDTAQQELKNKLDVVERTNEVVERVNKQAEEINQQFEKIKEHGEIITGINKNAEEKVSLIKEDETTITKYKEEISGLLQQSQKLQDRLEEQEKGLSDLSIKNKEQQELISALLPKGASAGLASAFAHRGLQVEKTKWIWMGIFIISIVALAIWSYFIVKMPPGGNQELWVVILQRIPLAAPFIWLGWFSAIQYGNTIRVQEDYAFKEATSKAFAGYRDHMEHLANVNLSEANTAMTLLSEKTIEVLSREPLRIYQKAERDATPAKSFLDILKRKKDEES
ncbi:MAG: hypothetical protein AB1638_08690 [Nitrospirota bacterium]